MMDRIPQLKKAFCFAVALALLFTILCQPDQVKADDDAINDITEGVLAERFAPMLFFTAGERTYPVNTGYFIENSYLYESVSGVPVLRDSDPTPSELGSLTGPGYADWYLDNQLGGIDDNGIIDAYQEALDSGTVGYTVYYHVTNAGSFTVVQYWFFYVFNKGTYNSHEGDWEMVQVVLDTSYQPISVMFSQHEYGIQAGWDDVERGGDQGESPKVYVAEGSHANYFRSYQGKIGFASDKVGNDGKLLTSEDYILLNMGETTSPSPSALWLDFGGRWGTWGDPADEFRGQRGPFGPVYRQNGEMWPGLPWGSDLQELNTALLPAEQFYYNVNWILFALIILAALGFGYRLFRKARKKELKPPYLSLLDIKGADIRSIGNILAIVGLSLGVIAAFLPYYLAEVNVASGPYATEGYETIVQITGTNGVQVNALDTSGALIQLGALPLPFGLFVLIVLMAFILNTALREPKKAGWRYARRGIMLMLPLALVIIGIMSISSLVPQYYQTDGSADALVLVSTVSENAIGGSESVLLPEYGAADMRWGVGIGAYLLAIAGVLLIMGGIMQFAGRKEAAHSPTDGQQVQEQQPVYQEHAPEQYQQPMPQQSPRSPEPSWQQAQEQYGQYQGYQQGEQGQQGYAQEGSWPPQPTPLASSKDMTEEEKEKRRREGVQ